MLSYGMFRRVALITIDVSEEISASIIRLTGISELERLAVNTNRYTPVTLMMEALGTSETSFFTRATRRTVPEDGILHSHRRENLKSYIALTGWAL
jgi:hypothetical protein